MSLGLARERLKRAVVGSWTENLLGDDACDMRELTETKEIIAKKDGNFLQTN